MEIIDNINKLLGDSLKRDAKPGSKLKIAASCFSIYAFEALREELETIESLQFIFTSPTFVPGEVISPSLSVNEASTAANLRFAFAMNLPSEPSRRSVLTG
jgi:hypothetical protein